MDKKTMQQLHAFRRSSGGFRASRVILTANNLGIFERLKTPDTAASLARKIKTDRRATELLLDAVTALGLLKKSGAKYRNTAEADRFLVQNSPLYQGDMLRHSDSLWKSWSGLDEVVRTGLPNRSGRRDHESFIRAMHNNAVFRAAEVVKAVDLKGVNRALDLGGGPGTYSMELARKGVAVTLFDLPDTVRIARTLLKEAKVGGVDFLEGDFHSDDIGNGYDLVFISQILHSLSQDECLGLLKKSRNALNAKGKIAVQEFFLEINRAHPVAGALFSINMLVNTAAGRCYSPQEMKAWLLKAGFAGIKTKILGDTVVLTGRKR
jgi:ubiquinone/menaquinone biosynthesis C-methylase UbiE